MFRKQGSLWMPEANGVGQMNAGFGAGFGAAQAIAAVAATSPALWYDTILSTLTPGTRNPGDAISAITDYNYAGRVLGTNPLHNGTQPTGAQKPLYSSIPNSKPGLTFNTVNDIIVGTAFGASTDHTFCFTYDSDNPALAALEWAFYSISGAFVILALAMKIGPGAAHATTLGFYDNTAFRIFTQNVLPGMNSYIVTLNGVTGKGNLFVNRNPVSVSEVTYVPIAIQNGGSNHWGADSNDTGGVIGKMSNLIYYPNVSATNVKAVSNLNHIVYGCG
jgi:hypothetical protein